MEALQIKNFKYGLDTRREALTSQLGTLVTLSNGHVNQGGEIEERKAFVPSAVPPLTYGLETTSAGKVVFGSRTAKTAARARTASIAQLDVGAAHGFLVGDSVNVSGVTNVVAGNYNGTYTVTAIDSTHIFYADAGNDEVGIADTGGTVYLVTSVYTSVVFQRLQHPAVLDGAAYDAQYHAMTAVRWSQSYLGSAYVNATFSDGRSFLYYNGSLVTQSSHGRILPGFANQATIQNAQGGNLVELFDALPGWAYTSFVSTYTFEPTATPVVIALSPITVTFVSTLTKSSTSGLFITLNDTGTAATPGSSGTASFTVNGGAGSSYGLYAPILPSAPLERAALLGPFAGTAFIDWATSNNATATAIAAAVNANTTRHGFTAAAVGAVVSIITPILSSNNLIVSGSSWGNLEVEATSDAGADGNHAFSATSVSSVRAIGQYGYYTFTGTWAVGDTWKIDVVSTGGDFTFGAGAVSVGAFTTGFVDDERVILANGQAWTFSGVGTPTGFEQQDVGSGSVDYTSQYGTMDTVQAFASYQGKLAVFGRYSTQLWTITADPNDFSRFQNIPNAGTVAPFSVGSLGQLETIFLTDTGIRSLRSRETTLNAYVTDLGSPIDKIIQGVMAGLTETQEAAAHYVVEPGSNRYWLFLSDTIYVLSYFPSSKIIAWSTYEAKYRSGFSLTVDSTTASGGLDLRLTKSDGTFHTLSLTFDTNVNTTAAAMNTAINASTATHGYTSTVVGAVVTLVPPSTVANISELVRVTNTSGTYTVTAVTTYTSFTPTKFIVYQGQVFARDTTYIYAFGGSANATFDGAPVTVEMPWLDDDSPMVNKAAQKIAAAIKGKWAVSVSMDPVSSTLETVATIGSSTAPNSAIDSTYDRLDFDFQMMGTHVKIKFVSSTMNAAQAVLSGITFKYKKGAQ